MSPCHCFKEESILPGWTIFSLLRRSVAVSNTASLSSPWASKFQARTEGNIWPFEMIQEVPDTARYERQEESIKLKRHLHFLMLQCGKWQQGRWVWTQKLGPFLSFNREEDLQLLEYLA